MLALEGLYATDTATHGNAEAAGIDIFAHLQATILHGLCGSREGVEGVDVVVADHRFVETVVFRMEVLHFGGHFDGEVCGVEFGDEVDTADTILDVVPQRVDVVSKRGDASHAGNIYSVHNYNMFSLLLISHYC